jgi:hypothetical protein
MADAEARARLRLIDALDEVRVAARVLGLDADAIGELHAPLTLRIDAWLWHVTCEAIAWRRIAGSPLFSTSRPRRVAA